MSSPKKFRAALVQLCSGREVPANITITEDLIRAAAADGANYIQTPENTPLMELETERLFQRIKSEKNTAILEDFAQIARELRIWLHIGSVAVQVDDHKAANRAFIFAPDGAIAARYDKIHMFDVNLANGESYKESKNYRPGSEAVLIDTPLGMLGVTTCYDLRFPEQYKALARAGANILTAPSAFTKQTGEAHWHILLRARAIETGCFMLAAAQSGLHENGRETFGHSLIVSPWGEILSEAKDGPGYITANIDLSQVEAARARIPSLNHTRNFDIRTYNWSETGSNTAISDD